MYSFSIKNIIQDSGVEIIFKINLIMVFGKFEILWKTALEFLNEMSEIYM